MQLPNLINTLLRVDADAGITYIESAESKILQLAIK